MARASTREPSAGAHGPAAVPLGRATAGGASSSLLALQQAAGNAAVGRVLVRRPVTVRLGTPPPIKRRTWAERASYHSRECAARLDETIFWIPIWLASSIRSQTEHQEDHQGPGGRGLQAGEGRRVAARGADEALRVDLHKTREPKFVEDAMAALWEEAASAQADHHGAHIHLLQEFLVDRAGGPGTGRLLRKLIAESTGPEFIPKGSNGTRKWWGAFWDAMFDDPHGSGFINHPESLGQILQEDLGLPRYRLGPAHDTLTSFSRLV
jgi:hypothetical protein